jgi:hypothetical protein
MSDAEEWITVGGAVDRDLLVITFALLESKIDRVGSDIGKG